MTMGFKKTVFGFAALLMTLPLGAGNLAVSSGPVTRGVWTADFATAKAKADKENVPLMVFWGSTGCGKCRAMQGYVQDEDFLTWSAANQIYLVFVEDTVGDAKEFAKNPTKHLPYFCIYWKKNSNVTVKENFSGRAGEMYSKEGKNTLWQLINSANAILAGWDPATASYQGGEFLVPDTANSRLEFVKGVTASVEVGLVRTENTAFAYKNVLKVGSTAQNVEWKANETAKTVPVDVSKATADVALTLLESDGKTVHASAKIHAVAEPANGVRNPKFVGEAFGWGEWTMDYAAAKAKVAANPDARLLAMFSGVLWCPYCEGIETSLLADASFKAWAKDNKIALVLFDQGRATTPASAAGQAGPRLVTTVADPNKSGADAVSGAAYVSRKAITGAQATAYMNLVTKYTAKWLAPGATAARLGNPTILLINPADETVAARFSAMRDANKVYAPAENVARLKELVKLAGSVERDAYMSKTTLTHKLGATDTATLQVNDAVRYYKMSGLSGSGRFKVTSASDVKVSIFRAGESAALAEGLGSAAVTLTSAEAAKQHYVKINAYPTAGSVSCASKGSTVKTVSLTSALVPIPGEIAIDQANFDMFKNDGSKTITLTRKNGSSGACSVVVRRVGGTAAAGQRYEWAADPVLTWKDGETGTKSFAFTMKQGVAYMADQTLELQAQLKDGEADVSAAKLVITLRDSVLPSLPKNKYDVTVYTGFNANLGSAQKVYNVNGPIVKLVKVSGALPAGVKLAYSKGDMTVNLMKSATKTGTYKAAYVIADGDKKGEPVEFNITVKDPAAVNPYVGKAITTVLPLFRDKVMVGQVSLSVAKNKRVKATYFCDATVAKTSFTGLFDGIDAAGTAYITIVAKNGKVFRLELTKAGKASVSVQDETYGAGAELASGEYAVGGSVSAFKGVYTVAFPALSPRADVPSGAGYMVVKFDTSAAVNKGIANCKIGFPNGKTASAQAAFLPVDKDFALLAVFKFSSKDVLAAPVLVRKNAATAPSRRAVIAPADAVVRWSHKEPNNSFALDCAAYGSYFNSAVSLETCCGADALELLSDKSVTMVGEGATCTVSGFKLALKERITGVSVAYTKTTGIFKGKTKVTLPGGGTAAAKFSGVILPDWHNCCTDDDDDALVPLVSGVPFAIGSAYYTGTLNGKRGTYGFAVWLDFPEE